MSAVKRRFLADDGAFLWVQFTQESRQVIVSCNPRNDRLGQIGDGVSDAFPSIERARDYALVVAAEWSLPIRWHDAEFYGQVSPHGSLGSQGYWAIRYGDVVLEDGATLCSSGPDAARLAVEFEAGQRGFRNRINWLDQSIPAA